MSLVFLVFTNLVLITRLWYQVSEGGVNWRLWWTKTIIELAGLALFEWHSWLLAAGATVILMNLAGVLWEALGWRRNAGHFALGMVYLLALSVWFSPAFGLKFWPVIDSAFSTLVRLTAFDAIFQSSFSTPAMLVLFGLLVAMSEMNLAVRAVFDFLNLKPRAAATTTRSMWWPMIAAGSSASSNTGSSTHLCWAAITRSWAFCLWPRRSPISGTSRTGRRWSMCSSAP